MLLVFSAIKGYAIQASDGAVGAVSDFLFDDSTWKVRWLVVETGTWLMERKILIHPSAIGAADHKAKILPVALTKAQVEDSPSILQNQPVSQQMESHLFNYYGWDPYWGTGYFQLGGIASPTGSPPYFGSEEENPALGTKTDESDPDPHLRSAGEVTGYHIHAADGDIGHLENILIDDANWDIRYLVVDTKNWWPGQHVLISPYAVTEIRWADRQIWLNQARDKVKSSPAWDPAGMIERDYEKRLHGHYGWPGYGFS